VQIFEWGVTASEHPDNTLRMMTNEIEVRPYQVLPSTNEMSPEVSLIHRLLILDQDESEHRLLQICNPPLPLAPLVLVVDFLPDLPHMPMNF
jgi:hypothetical protein